MSCNVSIHVYIQSGGAHQLSLGIWSKGVFIKTSSGTDFGTLTTQNRGGWALTAFALTTMQAYLWQGLGSSSEDFNLPDRSFSNCDTVVFGGEKNGVVASNTFEGIIHTAYWEESQLTKAEFQAKMLDSSKVFVNLQVTAILPVDGLLVLGRKYLPLRLVARHLLTGLIPHLPH